MRVGRGRSAEERKETWRLSSINMTSKMTGISIKVIDLCFIIIFIGFIGMEESKIEENIDS